MRESERHFNMYTKHQAIELMNKWGGQQLPFFFMIDFELQKPVVYKLDELPGSIQFEMNGLKSSTFKFKSESDKPFSFEADPIKFKTYENAFVAVKKELNYGNSYLLNLTFPTFINTNLCLKSIFARSRAPYKLLIENEFVVFSPEPFVKIKEGIISSYPMKGTLNASLPNAKQLLLTNPKEEAEHATIVDLIRNDLNKVATGVKVANYRYVEKIITSRKELLQVSSKIEGRLPDNHLSILGDIIFSLLPAGSISGAPKSKTVEIIKRIEASERGYFTGIVGIFDGSILDSGVLIRYIEQKNDEFVFRSGGGITAQSNGRTEYQELLDKVYVPFN